MGRSGSEHGELFVVYFFKMVIMIKCNSSPSKCLAVYKTFILSNHYHPTHLLFYPSPWVTIVSFLNFVDLRALIKVDSVSLF